MKKGSRWGISLVILAVLAWVFRDELDFIGDGFRRLKTADPVATVVVTIAAILAILAMAEVMRLLIRAGGVPVSFKETAAITLASNSWATTLPAGTAFAAILTFYVQRTWGATVVLCGWFLVLSSVVSTVWLALIGIGGVLFLNADMALWSLIATIIAMVVVSSAVFWASNNPTTIENWLDRQSFIKGKILDNLRTQVKNLHEVHLTATQFAKVSLFSLLNRLLDMFSLWACVWAVTGNAPGLTSPEDQTTLAGVALAYLSAKLAGSAQVTPAGLGTVEAAIIATLVATGMTAVDATGAAIIYRLITFALITIIGWVVYFWHYARNGINYASLNAHKSDNPVSDSPETRTS